MAVLFDVFLWLVISLSICFLLQRDGIVSEMETEFLTSQLWASEVIIDYLSTLLSRALCFLKLPCSVALWRYSGSELSHEPFCYHRYLLSLYTKSNTALIWHWFHRACWLFQFRVGSLKEQSPWNSVIVYFLSSIFNIMIVNENLGC